jgi:hypothetical protein
MFTRLHRVYHAVDFNVLYIGQAYGKRGSRHALDRLRKHETCNEFMTGAKDGYRLTILMLSIAAGTDLITMFNPVAENKAEGKERFKNGLIKLCNH